MTAVTLSLPPGRRVDPTETKLNRAWRLLSRCHGVVLFANRVVGGRLWPKSMNLVLFYGPIIIIIKFEIRNPGLHLAPDVSTRKEGEVRTVNEIKKGYEGSQEWSRSGALRVKLQRELRKVSTRDTWRTGLRRRTVPKTSSGQLHG